jgi:excisionase family DNA binding protein
MPFSGDPSRLVTLAEAADALGVSVRTVRRFIGYGYLEGFRVGPRAVRVRAGDVNRLVRRLPDGYADDEGDVIP